VAGRSSSPLSPAGGKITNPQTKLIFMLAANGKGDLSGRRVRATRFCPSRSQTVRSRRSSPQRVWWLLFVIPASGRAPCSPFPQESGPLFVIPVGVWPLVCHSRRESAFLSPRESTFACHSRRGLAPCLSFPQGICISLSRRESAFVCHSRRESAFASFTPAMAERRKAHPEGWAFHK
jgi:hypothetical protein